MNFVSLENKGKKLFAKFPKTRRFLKRIYQRTMYTISHDHLKVEGDIHRISPVDNYEYFYGYYDKSPWDARDRYMLALRVSNAHKKPDSIEEATIVVFDTDNNNSVIEIGTTHCWNTQQGCMAQWLGPDFQSKIIYNDFREGKYCAVIYNFEKKLEEKVLGKPIYDVAKDGTFALTLDFSRLHRLRKGYGYANLEETTKNELCPNSPCIWKIDLKTGDIHEVIKYIDLKQFETRSEMEKAIHKVNHIMISPNGKRFMVLHRWIKNNEKFTRLVTLNIDGTEMYNLSDDNFVSHCCWKNEKEILSFLRKKETGDHYYLLKDKTQDYKMLWEELNTDGHCTYSYDKKYVVTDTYPNRKRKATVYLCEENKNATKIASVFSPFKYDNDVRCDLHPRWNHKGDKICIDSVHEGKKELYVLETELDKINDFSNIKASVIIPCYNSAETINKTILSIKNQSHKNIEIIILNDGSNDNTEEIINNIDFGNLKYKYIPKSNTGVSDTRNIGLQNATGKYIFFVDSDDVISPNFIYKNIKECELNNAECVMSYQSRSIHDIEKGNLETITSHANYLNRNDMLEYFMYNKEKIVFASMIYRKELIDKLDLKFNINTKYGEDLEFAWKYLLNCKKIGYFKESMYGYYNNPKSAVNTVRWEKVDLVNAMKRVAIYLKQKNDSFYSSFCNYMLPRVYWTTAKTFALGSRKDYYKKFINEYDAKKEIKKLVNSSKNKLLKYSAIIFEVNIYLFYYLIKIIYKFRK